MLALLSSSLCLRLAFCGVLFRVPLEQRAEHRHWADSHCWSRGRLVLHQELQQGIKECYQDIGVQRLPLPPGFHCIWRLHHCSHPVHQVLVEVLRTAGQGPEEQDLGHDLEGAPVSDLVLREVRQVLEQECVHPDRHDGHELLHLREESLLPHPQERPSLRNRCHSGKHDPHHRRPFHHRWNSRPGLLRPVWPPPAHGTGRAHFHVHHDGLCCVAAVYQYL
mmetsp:Transcript_45580/g.85070  ORF Transcript_45580/g.85070 Transcript_45580/m.85070 type:complete len:221 (-) Transcript_45580:272-934(-)